MTDLHAHILPGMDDGPKDLAASLALLEQQLGQGVDQIVLTSHYHCEAEPPEEFLARRDRAFSVLQDQCPEGIILKRGCEVYFSPLLMEMDLKPLCMEGTDVLLLELPVLQKPAFLREVLMGLWQRGIVPLIAHAERYQYVNRDPRLLAEWLELGAVIQVNAQSVMDGGFARRLIRWGLCQIVASDAHSVLHRPANLAAALDTVAKTISPEKARELQENADALFSGCEVRSGSVRIPKNVLGFWI